MTTFAKISSIVPADPMTWKDKCFLTIDIDWAIDEAVDFTIDLLERAGVPATFFATHASRTLDRIRANPEFELGIHPNFNELLDGTADIGRNAAKVIAAMKEIIPDAISARSHSMTQSSRLLDAYLLAGITHDSNHFLPAHACPNLAPYLHWNGLTRVPYFWEDDVDMLYNSPVDVADCTRLPGLKVFDFHPIHVALNTRSMHHYESTRPHHRDWVQLRAGMQNGPGVCEKLTRLLASAHGASGTGKP